MYAPSEPGRPTALTLKTEVLISYETTIIFISRHGVTSPIISNLQAIFLFSKVSRPALRPTQTAISIPWAKRPGLEDQHSPPLLHMSSQCAW